MTEEKDNIIRQLVFQIKGELDYIERYAKKQREKLEELDIILSGQEQPVIEKDWVEKRKQECGCRKLSSNGNYQCERYEGVFGPCDGRCSWIVDYPKLKELEEREQPEVDLEKAAISFGDEIGVPVSNTFMQIARHFYELGQRKAAEMYDEVEYNRQRAEEETLGKTLDEATRKALIERVYSDACDLVRRVEKRIFVPQKQSLGEKGTPVKTLDEAAEEYSKRVSDGHNFRDLTCGFIAGAKWVAEQGVTLKVTDDTTWGEVNDFIHRNCDGAKEIQIRKK